jgi:hypothetical protein
VGGREPMMTVAHERRRCMETLNALIKGWIGGRIYE